MDLACLASPLGVDRAVAALLLAVSSYYCCLFGFSLPLHHPACGRGVGFSQPQQVQGAGVDHLKTAQITPLQEPSALLGRPISLFFSLPQHSGARYGVPSFTTRDRPPGDEKVPPGMHVPEVLAGPVLLLLPAPTGERGTLLFCPSRREENGRGGVLFLLLPRERDRIAKARLAAFAPLHGVALPARRVSCHICFIGCGPRCSRILTKCHHRRQAGSLRQSQRLQSFFINRVPGTALRHVCLGEGRGPWTGPGKMGATSIIMP